MHGQRQKELPGYSPKSNLKATESKGLTKFTQPKYGSQGIPMSCQSPFCISLSTGNPGRELTSKVEKKSSCAYKSSCTLSAGNTLKTWVKCRWLEQR